MLALRLLELFKSRAVAFGDFTLASGKKSSYYINSKKVLFHGEAIALLGELLYDATRDWTSRRSAGSKSAQSRWQPRRCCASSRPGRTLEGFFRPQTGEGARQPGARRRPGQRRRPRGRGRRRADDRRIGRAGHRGGRGRGESPAGGVHRRPVAGGAGAVGRIRLPAAITIRDLGIESPTTATKGPFVARRARYAETESTLFGRLPIKSPR